MTTKSRILMVIASLLLLSVFVFPIWKIQLEASQYPEGIGLLIWVNQITGIEPQDLQNINGLNHYIGMKAITPDSIIELKVMPYIFALLIGLGLIIAWAKSRKLLMTWIILFSLLSVIGLADYYAWGYDYGHNLDENAPIKVPGMTYQPPMIGTKTLLNMTATSLPTSGGWIVFLSLGLGIYVFSVDKKQGIKNNN